MVMGHFFILSYRLDDIGSELILYQVPPKDRRKVLNTTHPLKGTKVDSMIYQMYEDKARQASQLYWRALDLPPSSPPQETDSDVGQ